MDTTHTNSKQKRVQFDFSVEAWKRLSDLKEQADASTKAELIRKALKIYEWLVNESNQDHIIEVQDQDGQIVSRISAKMLLS